MDIECIVCGGTFTPLQRTHLSCSDACKQQRKRQKTAEWKSLHKARLRETNIAYKKANQATIRHKACLDYAIGTSPFAERALSLASRMNDSQKTRFADWLLKVNHKANRLYKIDHFISDYNSEGI